MRLGMEMKGNSRLWTGKQKAAVVLDLLCGKTTVLDAAQQLELAPHVIEGWLALATGAIESALRPSMKEVSRYYEHQLEELRSENDH